MTEALTFRAWLIEPGNHRVLQSIKGTLLKVLKKKVEIQSWPDLYRVWEEALSRDEGTASIFEPVFSVYPPAEERGANKRQVLLYRGALHNPEETDPLRESGDKTVTYRGQTIVVKSSATATPAADAASEEKSEKPARYYRGVKLD